MKPLRLALQCFLEDMRGKMFHGGDPDKYAKRKENKRLQAARAQQERAMDRQAADKTFRNTCTALGIVGASLHSFRR